MLITSNQRNAYASKIRGRAKPTKASHQAAQSEDSVALSSVRSEKTGEPRSTASVPVQFESPDLGDRLINFFTKLGKGKFHAELSQINNAEAVAKQLKTPAQFQAKTAEFKKRLRDGASLESLRVEAYAVARQAAVVATGMRPYDCQMLGALAMDDGHIAEMMTGEGKTLTAVMPLYLNALAGKGAHLVTVNDTLAQRDRENMGPIFELMGLTVGSVLEDMTPEQKREGYHSDVTYTTDRALGFDYLRDRTARSLEDRVQRPPFFALVDEVDQVLLDEARTPLIISGAGEAASEEFLDFDEIVSELRPGIEYFVDREKNSAWLSETGLDFVENELQGNSLSFKDADAVVNYQRKRGAIRAEGTAWKALHDHRGKKPGLWERLRDSSWSEQEEKLEAAHKLAQAKTDSFEESDVELFSAENGSKVRVLNASLKAHALFEEGIDYLVQDQEVKIVDENKGRTSKGRRFNEGLHQALEAKAKVPIHPESRPIASITYPNFFAHYPRLAGMSGTAKTSEGEFQELYEMSVVQVPTNLQFKLNPEHPDQARRHNRVDETDTIFASKKEKFDAVVAEAMQAYQEGVPVLVGTLSVEANEYVYAQLLDKGVARGAIQLLNAEHVRGDKSLENSIIAEAGRSGMVTVATSMAGRGVNIKPDFVNYKKLAMQVEALAGQQGKALVVDVETPQEAKRLGQWLEGQFPYQIGDGAPEPGQTLIRVGSEDDLPQGATGLNSNDFSTGGLFVIGTERAKSRRIDDQLIGRAARQGSPGRSKFYLSLEDELFHDFGGRALRPTLELLSGQDGKIESEMVEGLVEKVQSRVGEMHFEARDNTTKYDDVLNTQREAFYTIRDSILDPEAPLRQKLLDDTQEVVAQALTEALPKGSRYSAGFITKALADISEKLKLDLSWKHEKAGKRREVLKEIETQIESQVSAAFASFDKSDADLDEAYRQILLSTHDQAWSEHLDQMAMMKDAVQWVSTIGEKPENAYRVRGFETFETMILAIQKSSVEYNLPQIMVGASVLETDRKQEQGQGPRT